MLRNRVIPILLLKNAGLVKTQKFKNPKYVGDPINAVRIFNDKEVDELVFLDISATPQKRGPNFELIKDIATEAFMPFAYGGGITSLNEIEKLINLGVEKVVLNTVAVTNPKIISEAANIFGNQSIVVSIDIKKTLFNGKKSFTHCGQTKNAKNYIDYAKEIEQLGAGELIINSIDNDGMMQGYDLQLIKNIAEIVQIPVVAAGGAGNLTHFKQAIEEAQASAVAAGSLFVFNGPHRAVLISYPKYIELEQLFQYK
jgi:cyclase